MKNALRDLRITSAQYRDDYRLQLVFSDGHEQIVDFGCFLKQSLHPEIRKFLELKNFKKFKVSDGDLMWGDFDLIFPTMDLYNNDLGPRRARKIR